jgi:hypothetical protein
MSELTESVFSAATISTPLAARYMTQLCKHFEHKLTVTYDERSGQIAFAFGLCRLQAQMGELTLSLSSTDAASLAQLQDVVARHLLRFAFRDDLQIIWRSA